MKALIYIFFAGGLGSIFRYLLQAGTAGSSLESVFPIGTFAVNITGSLLIGLFYALSVRFHLSTDLRLLLTTGFCGGFTTFSTFSNNSLALLKNEMYVSFSLYILSSIIFGIAAAFAGTWLGKNLF